MNLVNYYWWYDGVVPNKFCNDVLKHAKTREEELALTGSVGKGRDLKQQPLSDKEIFDLKKKRDSNITWLNDQWIYNEIFGYVRGANTNAGWNFQWDHAESCQFTKYNKGQYYDWHCDSWDKPYDETAHKNYRGRVRKLSVTLNLSDSNDYEGGDLQFDFRNKDPDKPANILTAKETKSKGSLIIFPSDVWHRVLPVTKGTRYSLVMWCLGKPFV